MVFLVFSAYDFLHCFDDLWYNVKINDKNQQAGKDTIFMEQRLESNLFGSVVCGGDIL